MPHADEVHQSATNKVGIVVLNYRNYADTINCVRSLLAIEYGNTETVIVDNDSQNDSLGHVSGYLRESGVPHFRLSEGELETAAARRESVFLVQASSNRGYAAGNNVGIRLLLQRGAAYILILNNDTLVEPGFLAPLLEYLETHQTVGAAGPLTLDTQGDINWMCARRRPVVGDFFFRLGIGRKLFPNNHWIRRDTYEHEYPFADAKEVEILSGSCMLLRASFLLDIGLLDENTFLFYEEIILYERLKTAGLTSVLVPASRIVHKHAQSSATVTTAVLQAAFRHSLMYYWTRYRRVNRFVVTALILISRTPRNPFRKPARP
jgi:GT2 family glycosyltransferase